VRRARRIHSAWRLDHDGGIALAKKHASAQIVDNQWRLGDNLS
jgi:hypothetical protein